MGLQDTREWHYLRPLMGTSVPSNIMVVDTETYPITDTEKPGREYHHLRLWCAESFRLVKSVCTRQEMHTDRDAETFWQYVSTRTDLKRPLWIFTHNAGFDMTVLDLWRKAAAGDFEFVQYQSVENWLETDKPQKQWSGIAVLDDPPTILKFRLRGTTRTIVVVDTFNYFRQSLADIGDSIGCAKSIMPPYNAPDEVWADYCYQDVKVLKSAVLALIQLVVNEDLGGLAYTISSMAMRAYRKRFMPSPKAILIHGNTQALQLERESYHGGATHCWYVGPVCHRPDKHTIVPDVADHLWYEQGPVYELDVQSFYPAIMKDYPFPCKLAKVLQSPSVQQLWDIPDTCGVIADVRLNCGPPGFPVTRNGKTFYAIGQIRTTLAGPELGRAMTHAYIKDCALASTYDMADLFSGYVNHFWQLRQDRRKQGDVAFAYVAKLLLNSLYGKFGQKKWKWQEDSSTFAPVPFGNWYERQANSTETIVYRSLGWLPQRQNGQAEHPDSFPAISSYVTSYGRELILKYSELAGLDNCYYSDTDSLHVNKTGLDRLRKVGFVVPGQIGFMSVRNTWDWCVYRGVKNYSTPDGNVIAGIKPDAKKESATEYRQDKFQRLASVINGGELNKIAVESVLVKVQESYRLGEVDHKNRVQPILLKEW